MRACRSASPVPNRKQRDVLIASIMNEDAERKSPSWLRNSQVPGGERQGAKTIVGSAAEHEPSRCLRIGPRLETSR